MTKSVKIQTSDDTRKIRIGAIIPAINLQVTAVFALRVIIKTFTKAWFSTQWWRTTFTAQGA